MGFAPYMYKHSIVITRPVMASYLKSPVKSRPVLVLDGVLNEALFDS